MDLFNKMKNIREINIEKNLQLSIEIVKIKLSCLTRERMCKVYSSYLLDELNNNHVHARLVNTLDLGLSYEHQFILISNIEDESYFLSDLTYEQFNDKSNLFDKLKNDGYQKINDDLLNCYLKVVSLNKYHDFIGLDDVYYMKNEVNKKM